MAPSPCTRPCQELSKDTKNMIWSIPGSVDLITTKQNKLPSFIDRWQGHSVTQPLFCLSPEISQTRVLHEVVFISWKKALDEHRGWCINLVSFRVFGATLWKLLIIEPIFSMKIKFKIDTEHWNLGAFLVCCWKGENCEKNYIKISKKLQKNWVWKEKKNQLSPQFLNLGNWNMLRWMKILWMKSL